MGLQVIFEDSETTQALMPELEWSTEDSQAGADVQLLSRTLLLALTFAVAACGSTVDPPKAPVTSTEWSDFEGSWSAAGSRSTIFLGAERKASIVRLEGTMLLAGAGRPGVGFRSELIALVDSETGLVGRGVWTDERGDQVFSELKGEGTAERNHITGTILGGTGRYAGAIGSYEFSWQFVIELDDGSFQGRTVGLKGRVRRAQPNAENSRP